MRINIGITKGEFTATVACLRSRDSDGWWHFAAGARSKEQLRQRQRKVCVKEAVFFKCRLYGHSLAALSPALLKKTQNTSLPCPDAIKTCCHSAAWPEEKQASGYASKPCSHLMGEKWGNTAMHNAQMGKFAHQSLTDWQKTQKKTPARSVICPSLYRIVSALTPEPLKAFHFLSA